MLDVEMRAGRCLGYHIRMHLADGRVIAPTPVSRRLVARVVLAHGRRRRLISANLVDSHLHLVALCDRRSAGSLAHGIGAALRQRLHLPVGFRQYDPVPITDQQHLMNAVRYSLSQHRRHGVDPLDLVDGSNIPDLLGMRLVGRYSQTNLRGWLPRVRSTDLVTWAGIPAPKAADGPLGRVAFAAMTALGLESLDGSSLTVIRARRAALSLLDGRAALERIASDLHTSRAALHKLRARTAVDAQLVHAIRLQLGFWQGVDAVSVTSRLAQFFPASASDRTKTAT